ncbi:unnamed protein product [Rhizophagus irregularis]|nr:unnamed protein product [Rhizophagus irregularis]
MTISAISEWAKTKFKSNWTRLFHSNIHITITCVSGIENDCARPSKDRMLLIIQENVIFMIFQLFQLWFCLNAVIKQNTIQIITLTVINFLCALLWHCSNR